MPNHVMYLPHGSKIRGLREGQGLSQKDLADRALIGLRTLSSIEKSKRTITPEVAHDLAVALGVTVGQICDPVISWQWVPELEPAQQRKLSAAIKDDMQGQHAKAVAQCRELLAAVAKAGRFENFAAVFVKLITFMDHAGDHQQALDELDSFLQSAEEQNRSACLQVHWARYHRGICLRRLKRYDEAKNELQTLQNDSPEYEQAAAYQLAVADLKQTTESGDHSSFVRLLTQFEQCHDAWSPLGTHRHAYPLRRMGQVHALADNHRQALTCLLDALEIFARHHCDRYVEETRADIQELIVDPLCPA